MSWSRSANGPKDEVRTAVENWPDEQTSVDRTQQDAPPGMIAGHRAEVESAAAAVRALVDGLGFTPSHQSIEVQALGHSNPDGTGQVSITINHVKTEG